MCTLGIRPDTDRREQKTRDRGGKEAKQHLVLVPEYTRHRQGGLNHTRGH